MRYFVLILCLSLGACASQKSLITSFKPRPLINEERTRLAETATAFIGRSSLNVDGRKFRDDCSGAVRAIFAAAKLRLGGIIKKNGDNDVKSIYRYVYKYGSIKKNEPLPGDLVFFHNTFDRSRNGRMSDALTHIGIVEKISGDTVFFVHHLGQAIIRSRLNLNSPQTTIDPISKTRINHILRKANGRERAYTTAELFAGYGRL